MKVFKMLALAGVMVAGTVAQAQEKLIVIGTGGQTGVYFVVGQSICRLVNRGIEDHGVKCSALPSNGSIDNINEIKAGGMDMAFAQSDWQLHAYNGTSKFEGQKFDNLRAVFSVHVEPFNVIARTDSGIRTFDDLKGKRVNIGVTGSGQRATMEVIMEAKGWTMDDFELASELEPEKQAEALGENKVDAIIYVAGHPNGSIQRAVSTIDARVLPVTGDAISGLIRSDPSYVSATIPGGLYKGTDADVNTFGVKATFVTSTEVEEDVVYQVVKAVFDNFDRFKRLHPAFQNLTTEEMITGGLSAPLHPGAVKYYREQGWM